jgi:hypothetical protein
VTGTQAAMPDGQPTKLAEAERPVCVLVISPNPKVHGGVSTFVELMKEHLKNCRVTSFWVGSISGEKESFRGHPAFFHLALSRGLHRGARKVRCRPYQSDF